MPDPKEVTPANFKPEHILYSIDGFSIAYGKWESKSMRIAMRWDGDEFENKGYPKTFGHPVWFVIPEALKIPILRSIIGQAGCKKEILDVLSNLKDIWK